MVIFNFAGDAIVHVNFELEVVSSDPVARRGHGQNWLGTAEYAPSFWAGGQDKSYVDRVGA